MPKPRDTRPYRSRDRRGRGVRGPLAPPSVPLTRTRAERFDDLVLDAVEELERHWSTDVAGIEFAVEDVPPLDDEAQFDPGVVMDRGVPLGRLFRDGLPGLAGPVIVLYRRPVEVRSASGEDRGDIVFAVVAELSAELLGKDLP